ncbi:MAG TPA: MobQ family relaxase, partial [Caulobacteraceae bacterium]|nr:MobQ family relaxase [Caulobacteraceae bacterium]
MASFLCQVQTIQRSEGRSAVAAAAYRAGARLVDERLAMEFDFAAKAGVEFSEVLTPAGAPAAFSDREALWNAAETAERRKDGVPAREILLALPHELDFGQRRALVRAFVAEHVTGLGMVADVAMHTPGAEGDQRNFHAHILVTTRRLTPEGFGAKAMDWRSPAQLRAWREGWADLQNEHLRRHLGLHAPQVSHLSLADQGLARDPTEHLGPAATALERKGERTDRGERNRDIDARNGATDRARRDYSESADRIAARAPMVEAPIEQLIAEARRVRASLQADRDAWTREREGLAGVRVPTTAQVERSLLDEDRGRLARARLRRQAVEQRVRRTRSRRLALVGWIRNPARMIWAKHAELNAIARARRGEREAALRLQMRQAWLGSAAGQTLVAARRQPGLDAAAAASRQRRTLARKIRRMERRIEAASG